MELWLNSQDEENEGKLFGGLLRCSFLDAVKISEKDMLALFMKKAESLNRVPVLISDEANEVLREGEGANATTTFLK
jgi:hypothetical protein